MLPEDITFIEDAEKLRTVQDAINYLEQHIQWWSDRRVFIT